MSPSNKIAVLTDSASNITENIPRGIFVVPLYVNIGEISKKDLEEISPAELYSTFENAVPTTAAPSTEDFLRKIKRIREHGYSQVLGVTISSALSATLNSMKIALEESGLEHRIVDSKNVTMGEGLLAYHAADLIAQGLSLDEVYAKVSAAVSHSKLFAMVSDLKYLIRGGRLKPIKGLLGTVLHINPILTLTEKGRIEPCESVRGKNRALKKLRELSENFLNGCEKYALSLVYAKDKADIAELRELMKDLIDKASLYEEKAITAVLGAQAGPSVQVINVFRLDD